MGLKNEVNKHLSQMHSQQMTGKGEYGEKAAFLICEDIYKKMGGILYHSFSFKVAPNVPGNIKKSETGSLYIENLGNTTEIDILLCTKYKVFPIEIKAYKAKSIVLTDGGISGCFKTDKSPVHQNEMHCRHLYAYIAKSLPNGDTRYIEPLVCFVDDLNDPPKMVHRSTKPVIYTPVLGYKKPTGLLTGGFY